VGFHEPADGASKQGVPIPLSFKHRPALKHSVSFFEKRYVMRGDDPMDRKMAVL